MDDEKILLKKRIKHNDITQLDIVYTDDTHINILVPWEDGNSEYDNKYQHNYIKDDMIVVDIDRNYDEEKETQANDECYEIYKYDMYEEKYHSDVLIMFKQHFH